MGDDEHGSNSNNGGNNKELDKVPFYKMFSFADRWDLILMIVGSISAIANGIAPPLMTLILGQIINSFGISSREHVVHEVSKVIFIFYFCLCMF